MGGGWIHSEFSVLLWSKALVLDLDQAEQYFSSVYGRPTQAHGLNAKISFENFALFFSFSFKLCTVVKK